MDNMKTIGSEKIIYFRTPALPLEKSTPVSIYSVSLTKREGEQDVLRFEIRRDLRVKVQSFTIRYRFSPLPVFKPDPSCKFNGYVYDAEDINTSKTIEISAVIPSHMNIPDCGAYISEIKLESGQILSYEASEYRFMRKLTQTAAQPAAPTLSHNAPTTVLPAVKEQLQTRPAPAPTPTQTPPNPERQKKKRARLGVILVAAVVVLTVEIIYGIHLYNYLGIKNSADMLTDKNRYNEAYKIAYDAKEKGVLQKVCEKAALYYAESGDLEMAYVYAVGAPRPFPDLIIDYAAQSVVNATTGKINEGAFRVAKMSESDEKFDSITHSVCDILANQADFSNALRVASELRDATDRDATENDVFTKALTYYVNTHRYREAAAFIDDLENIPTFEIAKKDAVSAAIDVCETLGDSSGIIYLSQHYPDLTSITPDTAVITADDAGVRSEFSIIYPLLNEEQRRSYHAQTVAVWNGSPIIIRSGKIEGTKITDAVSVDTNSTLTLVLHKTGAVSVIPHDGMKAPFSAPTYTDIIDIALGEAHAVLLHADGTVSVLGDNSFGQADVSGWTDIVAVAAGQRFTLGLKMNGTVVAAGSNSCSQCEVSTYRNVVDIAACNQTSVMLFSDGTVMIQGYRSMGLAYAETVTGVKRIRAGGAAILTEMDDGTYKLFPGQVGGYHGDPYNWLSMTAFDVGMVRIAGIDKDGATFFDGDGLPS